MSAPINTGGPAFPGTQYVSGVSPSGHSAGMCLRDYFAAHSNITYGDAIEWLDCYGGEVVGPWKPDEIIETLVRLRFEYADAMLRARNGS